MERLLNVLLSSSSPVKTTPDHLWVFFFLNSAWQAHDKKNSVSSKQRLQFTYVASFSMMIIKPGQYHSGTLCPEHIIQSHPAAVLLSPRGGKIFASVPAAVPRHSTRCHIHILILCQ